MNSRWTQDRDQRLGDNKVPFFDAIAVLNAVLNAFLNAVFMATFITSLLALLIQGAP